MEFGRGRWQSRILHHRSINTRRRTLTCSSSTESRFGSSPHLFGRLAGEYFDVGPNSRFLATVGTVKPSHRATFAPAILGDGRVRVHTVTGIEQTGILLLTRRQGSGEQSGLSSR